MSTSGGFPTTGVDMGYWLHNRFKELQRARQLALATALIGRLVTIILLLRILRRLNELERRRARL